MAAVYCRRSSEQGNLSGQCLLGVCHEFRIAVARDLREAEKYYGLSPLQDNVGWEHKLGFNVENECCYDGNFFRLEEYYVISRKRRVSRFHAMVNSRF
jgi:TPR repeat protein